MLRRVAMARVASALAALPVVALVGSRQCGKTTLVKNLLDDRERPSVYVDLELPSDRAKLAQPELFLARHRDRLVILDEIQHAPELLFKVLRALVDQHRRPGRFLLLGSAAPALLRQVSESLAGRITYVELTPFLLGEVAADRLPADRLAAVRRKLWLAGGYPDSFLAPTAAASEDWRAAFIAAFLARDLPELGIRVSPTRLRRFWQMLAHAQGGLWNASEFARNFDVSQPTARHYLDILTDTFITRQLQPLHANLRKRLVKAPKVYLRDSGLLHTLLRIADHDELQGHPVLGASFEGFAIEQILARCPKGTDAAFYRTHTGVELDLVLDLPGARRIGVEVKHTAAPRLTANLVQAIADVGCSHAWVVTAGRDTFPLREDVTAAPLEAFLDTLPSARSP